jgi:hypothetical protein
MAKTVARILAVAVACLLTTAAWADGPLASGEAEEAPTGLVGQRVRLSGPSLATKDEPVTGRVVAVDAEAITVVQNKRTGETRRIPFSSIKRLDIARPGWGSHAGTGAAIGVVIPIVAAMVVAQGKPGTQGDFAEMGPGLAAAAVFVVGVPTGALIGAIVGSQCHTDGWERVPIRRVRVSVLPDLHGGVRGGLTVRF